MTENVQENVQESISAQQGTTRNEKLQKVMQECENSSSCEIKGNETWSIEEVYKTTKLGMTATEILRPFSNDKGFRNLLMRQYSEYSNLAKEIEIYAAGRNVELKENNIINKAMMFISATLNTLKDKSNSKLSEIMIQGINMGIIRVTKVQNSLSDRNENNQFADRMMNMLQQNLEDMKLFL